jgi:hypothetical protein
VHPGREDRLYLHTPGLEGDTVRHAIILLGPSRFEPLIYSVREPGESTYADLLRITVTEVCGSCPRVAPEEFYLVRGRYELQADEELVICLGAHGKSSGNQFVLSPGSGEFEVWCKAEEVTPGMESILDVCSTNSKPVIGILLGETQRDECAG